MTFSKTDFLILELMPYLRRPGCEKEDSKNLRENIEQQYLRVRLEGGYPRKGVPQRKCTFNPRKVIRRRTRKTEAKHL